MKKGCYGIGKIFAFTWKQKAGTKKWIMATLLIALVLFAIPAVLLPVLEGAVSKENTEDSPLPKTVYVWDEIEGGEISYDILNRMGFEGLENVSYILCDEKEEAKEKAAADPESLILIAEALEGKASFTILLPEESSLTDGSAALLEELIASSYPFLLMEKCGISEEEAEQILLIVSMQNAEEFLKGMGPEVSEEAESEVSEETGTALLKEAETELSEEEKIAFPEGLEDFFYGEASDENEETGEEGNMAKEAAGMLLPFVLIMFLYFVVLFYGQGIANSVIMEKTSKLMDTFLLSVRPEAMVIGKVTALVSAALLQCFFWLAALAGGFACGIKLVLLANPDSTMTAVGLWDFLGELTAHLQLPNVVAAFFIASAGILLYCALSAFGASMAEKPEDLSSVNMLFTMILVISFFAILYYGGVDSLGSEVAPWMNWIPFTAVLAVPGQLLTGKMSLAQGGAVFAEIVFCCVLLMALAGKMYRACALYKGKVPGVKAGIRLLADSMKK